MDQRCDCHKTRKRSGEELKLLCNRLSRIEGQVRGLREMLGRDVDRKSTRLNSSHDN